MVKRGGSAKPGAAAFAERTTRIAHAGPANAALRSGDSELIYRQIAAAIREQRLVPGAKLGEEQLGRIFHVGRPVVRQALTRLAHEHVVEIKPNRGAFVATPTEAQAREVFEARRIVEALTARTCAQKATKRDIARLRQHVQIEQQAWERAEREEWIRLTGEFHLLLADIIGNGEIRRFLDYLVGKTSLIIALYGGAARSSCPDDHHSELVDAIEARDADRAERLMQHHLVTCEAGLAIAQPRGGDDLEAILMPERARQRRSA